MNICWTFVVFYFPPPSIAVIIFPVQVLRNGEECLFLLALDALHDGGDELFEETIYAQKGRPEVVQEVDEETLYVGAVMVLIGHDHQVPVSQLTDISVLFAERKSASAKRKEKDN